MQSPNRTPPALQQTLSELRTRIRRYVLIEGVALTVVVLVRIGARIYRGAALRTGARISLKEAWRSAEA